LASESVGLRVPEQTLSQPHDVFICHACDDCEPFVRPFVAMLHQLGLSVLYENCSLQSDDNVSRKIDDSIERSRYGIVIISKAFIDGISSKSELQGLVDRDADQDMKLLAIWHGVTNVEVAGLNRSLLDKFAINAGFVDASEIAIQISPLVRRDLYDNLKHSELERLAIGNAAFALQKEIDQSRIKMARPKHRYDVAVGVPWLGSEVTFQQTNWDLAEAFACGFRPTGGAV
jgi:TIR domain